MHAAKFLFDPAGQRLSLDTVHDNVFWAGAAARISVCIPAFRHDVSLLIAALARCEASGLIEIVVYDDGSRDHALLAAMEASAGQARAAVRIVSAQENKGRAAARNAAIAHARADWVLLLDADMAPDTAEFIEAYLNAIDHAHNKPAVIVGGYSLRTASRDKAFALHRWQAEASECIPARHRRISPGRYVFSSNVLVHRDVLAACPFDEGFAGWGWEDTDWGLSTQQCFPIVHIDNTASHLGLDRAQDLMGKYARSGANFARMAARHPEAANAMPLYRMAKRFKAVPFRKSVQSLAGGLAKADALPVALRGRALKAWRALVYSEVV